MRFGLLLSIAICLVGPVEAGFDEAEVQAVYLYNFASFIDWPAEAFDGDDAPLRYCVARSHPLYEPLAQLLQGESAGGHPLRISGLDALDRGVPCHVLFVDRGNREKAAAASSELTVTVSDIADFATDGGMIGLVSEDQRIRLEVNRDAIERSRLRVSSKLLRVARSVGSRRR